MAMKKKTIYNLQTGEMVRDVLPVTRWEHAVDDNSKSFLCLWHRASHPYLIRHQHHLWDEDSHEPYCNVEKMTVKVCKFDSNATKGTWPEVLWMSPHLLDMNFYSLKATSTSPALPMWLWGAPHLHQGLCPVMGVNSWVTQSSPEPTHSMCFFRILHPIRAGVLSDHVPVSALDKSSPLPPSLNVQP